MELRGRTKSNILLHYFPNILNTVVTETNKFAQAFYDKCRLLGRYKYAIDMLNKTNLLLRLIN